MRHQEREVARRTLEGDRGRHRGSGLEADGEEDDLAGRARGDPHRLVDGQDSSNVAAVSAGAVKRATEARHAEHVAERAHRGSCLRDADGRLDVGRRGDADGTARSLEDTDRLGKQSSQSVAGDRDLVGAADVDDLYRFPRREETDCVRQLPRATGVGEAERVCHGRSEPSALSPCASTERASSSNSRSVSSPSSGESR